MTSDQIENAKDHFELFGLERRFDLDEKKLQSNLLELARLTHPDHAGDDAEAQMRAMDLSAKVNEAHRALADPESRANYLLQLLGGPSKEQDRNLPKGFLEKMMMVREDLADAQVDGDKLKLDEFELHAKNQRQQHLSRLATLFEQTPPPLADIRTELNAMRYIERMLEQIHPDSAAQL
jgi:molecular chaperone HscB